MWAASFYEQRSQTEWKVEMRAKHLLSSFFTCWLQMQRDQPHEYPITVPKVWQLYKPCSLPFPVSHQFLSMYWIPILFHIPKHRLSNSDITYFFPQIFPFFNWKEIKRFFFHTVYSDYSSPPPVPLRSYTPTLSPKSREILSLIRKKQKQASEKIIKEDKIKTNKPE